MKLRQYVDSLPRGALSSLASDAEISAIYMSQLVAGHREASPRLAVLLEQLTGKKVMRWDLRPTDWHLIWPELRLDPAAPTIPDEAGAQQPATV